MSVLVNNAGVLSNNKAEATSAEEWRRILAVNLDGAFYLSREFVPGMKQMRWGRIVNICSLAMKTGGLTAGTAYTASKGGMAALTFSLARELASFGVTVNGVAPAYIKTPMITDFLSSAQQARLLEQIPVGRFCEPEEVAHVRAVSNISALRIHYRRDHRHQRRAAHGLTRGGPSVSRPPPGPSKSY